MKLFAKKLLGILVLATYIESGNGNIASQNMKTAIVTINSFQYARLVDAMLTIVRTKIPFNLCLLYSKHYTDVVDQILNHSVLVSDRLTVLEHANIDTSLKERIRAFVDIKTYLFVFCHFQHTLDIFKLIRNQTLESHFVTWVVIVENEPNVETPIQDIEKLLREGTQVVLLLKDTQGTFSFYNTLVDTMGIVRFQMQFKLGPNRDIPTHHLMSLLFPEENALSGRELIVTANDNWPFFGVHKNPDGSIGRLHSGIDVSIVKSLKKMLNFTFKVVSPQDGKWGGPLPNGSVTGMIGMVARHEANLAICEITITGSRESVVDFTFPYYQESITLISRAPAQKNRAFAVFSPFTDQVWLGIVVSILAIGPILTLQAQLMKVFQAEGKGSDGWLSLLEKYSFNMFRSMMVQNNLIRTRRWPHRFVFFFWYIFCIIVSALYSGTLTAVLAIPAYETPVDALEDLPKAIIKEGFTVGTIGDSSLEFLFKAATEGIYKDVWKLFNHEDRSKSFLSYPEQGFDKILAEKFVFVCPRLASEIFARKRDRSKFYFARQSFYPQGYGIACPTGSPYKKKFDQLLARMVEGGLITKWAADEAQKVSMTTAGEESHVRTSAITLTHLQAAFFVLILGFVVGALSLFTENIYFFCGTKM